MKATDMLLADESSTDGWQWPLQDHEQTVRDLWKASTGAKTHANYNAFGKTVGPALNELFGYTGQQQDTETGLSYYNQRYYDPNSGRFLSEDPSGFSAGDVNLYRYVGNDPVNNTDPSGLQKALAKLQGGNAGPSMSAYNPSFWQQTTNWASNVWNYDFSDSQGFGTMLLDNNFTSTSRFAVHQVAKPVGNAVTGLFQGIASLGKAVYDNTLGYAINGSDYVFESNVQRFHSVINTVETISNWDQVPVIHAQRAGISVVAGAAASYGTGIAATKVFSPLVSAPVAESSGMSIRPPITLYHQGDLSAGVSGTRALSTSPTPNLLHYNPGGQLYKFQVPADVYDTWRFNNSIQTFIDYHAPSGIATPEIRIMPPATAEMSGFMVRPGG